MGFKLALRTGCRSHRYIWGIKSAALAGTMGDGKRSKVSSSVATNASCCEHGTNVPKSDLPLVVRRKEGVFLICLVLEFNFKNESAIMAAMKNIF